MVLKTTRRKQWRKKRGMRSRRPVIRAYKGNKVSGITRIKTKFILPDPDNQGAVLYGGGQDQVYRRSFSLTDLPANEITGIQALYDMYKITTVVLTFFPLANVNTSTPASIPTLTYYVDYDDVNLPANQSELLEFATSHVKQFNKAIKVVIRPKTVQGVYSPTGGGALVSAGIMANRSSMWFPTGNTTIQYNGLKWANNTNGGVAGAQYRILATYYIALKKQK